MSVLLFSRFQASSRSRRPFISGQASTATVSARTSATVVATLSSPPATGTPATSSSVRGPAKHTATTDRPW